MDERFFPVAGRIRDAIVSHSCTPNEFRNALLNVSFCDRDAWVDLVFGLDELLPDGPELPQGCVPYLPCPVEALLFLVDAVPMQSNDLWVDVGSGMGRAAVLLHLLTGLRVLGVEIQSSHVQAALLLRDRLGLSNVSFVQKDVLAVDDQINQGTLFFLYCPFSGARLANFLQKLETWAQERDIWVCTLDLPLPERGWLVPFVVDGPNVRIYKSSRKRH